MVYITDHKERGAEYYSDIYRKGYSTANYRPLYDGILKGLLSLESPRVLELGCGIGDLGKMIVEKGIPYRGFDFSEEAIRQCKEKCPQGDFFVADIYDPKSFQPVDYNAVIAVEVLEHVDDFKVLELIPAGARVVASVPGYNDPSHLRVYQDSEKDICKRYARFLHITSVTSGKLIDANAGKEAPLWLFHSIKTIA